MSPNHSPDFSSAAKHLWYSKTSKLPASRYERELSSIARISRPRAMAALWRPCTRSFQLPPSWSCATGQRNKAYKSTGYTVSIARLLQNNLHGQEHYKFCKMPPSWSCAMGQTLQQGAVSSGVQGCWVGREKQDPKHQQYKYLIDLIAVTMTRVRSTPLRVAQARGRQGQEGSVQDQQEYHKQCVFKH